MLWLRSAGDVWYSDFTMDNWIPLSDVCDDNLQHELEVSLDDLEKHNPRWIHIIRKEQAKRRDAKLEKITNNLR